MHIFYSQTFYKKKVERAANKTQKIEVIITFFYLRLSVLTLKLRLGVFKRFLVIFRAFLATKFENLRYYHHTSFF